MVVHTPGFEYSSFVLGQSFVIRYSCLGHSNHRLFLNLIRVFIKLLTKRAREIRIVQDDHVGVVLLMIVVLPAFVPPAETDHAGPSI